MAKRWIGVVLFGAALIVQGVVGSGVASQQVAKVEVTEALVNINAADKDQLMTLTGVGEKIADAIIRYRETHGSFKNVNDLLSVKGIGEKKLQGIRAAVTVD